MDRGAWWTRVPGVAQSQTRLRDLAAVAASDEESMVYKDSGSADKDPGLIPVSGRSPGEGNGNPLQYSCLDNPVDGGAWWAAVHRVAESDTTEAT